MTQHEKGGSLDEESPAAAEKRKLRNRLSQQAFRKRQNAYIKELERRLGQSGKTENERIIKLEEENQALRKQIASFIANLEKTQRGLQSLSTSMSNSLEGVGSARDAPPSDLLSNVPMPSPSSHMEPGMLASGKSPDPVGIDRLDPAGNVLLDESYSAALEAMSSESTQVVPLRQHDPQAFRKLIMDASSERCQDQSIGGRFDTLYPSSMSDAAFLGSPSGGLPGVWTHEYQMGIPAYKSAIDSTFSLIRGHKTTNSAFADHITWLQYCVRKLLPNLEVLMPHPLGLKKLRLLVSLMLSFFNSLARPLAMSWYTPTRFYGHISDVTLWQLNPTKEMYSRLHPRYRPSGLQIIESYPPIIDWIPFPTVRDKLILLHAANPCLDEVICDVATSYSVETDISKIVDLDTPTPGYVRIWDLIGAMGGNQEGTYAPTFSLRTNTIPMPRQDYSHQAEAESDIQPSSGHFDLPVPSAEVLFNSKEYACLAFKALHLEDGISRFKLDPALFSKYPELFDPSSDIIATGIPLVPPRQIRIPGPSPLDLNTMNLYCHFAEWSHNALNFFFSGSTNQITVRENTAAFSNRLRPPPVSFPLCISPAGLQAVAHPTGELATSRACVKRYIHMGISCYANHPVEAIVSAALEISPLAHAMQLYTLNDKARQKRTIKRAEEAGCKAIL
ncbi:hypothetical protein BBP40_010250 [Aspergillus hancockii]|nr:hypothetical protein BBP40_010250 [Aspergillus hancockii]